MAQCPKLPYYCETSLLPGTLPTTEEIKNAPSPFVEGTSTVVRVADCFVAKYGSLKETLKREGFNMLFVIQNLPTRIPFLYALYEDDEHVYLVMEFIPGQTLESLWSSLQPRERKVILGKLKTIVDKMRSLPQSSTPFYGSVNRGPLPYFLFWTPEPTKEINGPFENEADFCLGLVERIRQIRTENHFHMSRVAWFRQHLPRSLTGHDPTFTHGDLQNKNIIVQRIGSSNSSEMDDFDIILLDWQDAGWYPSYFEYFMRYTAFYWDDEWPQLVETFLEPFPVETMILMPVYHDIFF